jgi:hypothetical protein
MYMSVRERFIKNLLLCFDLHLQSCHHGFQALEFLLVLFLFDDHIRGFISALTRNICYKFLLFADSIDSNLVIAFPFRRMSLFAFRTFTAKLGLLLFDNRGVYFQTFTFGGFLQKQAYLPAEILA